MGISLATGSVAVGLADDDGYGIIRAFDPKTGDQKWEYKMGDTTWGGVLTTASDLVFSGGREGYFYALDGNNGNLLWKQNLGGQVNSGPMSYMVNNHQWAVYGRTMCVVVCRHWKKCLPRCACVGKFCMLSKTPT